MGNTELARDCAAHMLANDRASRHLGIDIEVIEAGVASAQMLVHKLMLNGFDICHGGYIFTLADTAFAFACNGYDNVTVAAAASIEYLKPVHENDRLTAIARELYRAGRSGIYDVEVRNQHGTVVAIFRGRAHASGKPLRSVETDT
jgi:acyl-CoA thioesterase